MERKDQPEATGAEARTGAEPAEPEIPKTWADAEERTQEFEALLKKYDGDFQKATDAQLRGERADLGDTRGSASIF